jgi:RNA polymerase sigma factor (sigma-70 family)
MHGKSVEEDRDTGAAGSFDELCSAHATRAWGFASRLTQCSADADDVMQDAFVVAWRKRDLIPAESWPWFCTVVSNCARNHRRKTGKVQRMASIESVAPEDSGEVPARAAEINELRTELVAALNELGPEEHQAVALCVLGGLTQAAASELTGTNLNTIKARVRRGLERLREKLKNRPDSIEAFLALPVLPYPPDTLEGAVARWSEAARGADVAAAVTAVSSSKAILVTCVVMLVVGTGLNVAYNFSDVGRDSPVVSAAPESPVETAPGLNLPRDTQGPLSPVDKSDTDAATESESPVGSFALAELPADLVSGEGERDQLLAFTLRYPSGIVRERGTALQTPNGPTRHGHCTYYYDTGELYAEVSYVRGLRQGAWTEFHKNGSLSFRAEYVADLKHGLITYYEDDGTPHASGEYFEGKKVGTWTTFYPSGDHKRLDTFVDGVLSGIRKDFNPGGVLFQTTEYANNKKNGLQIEYDAATGNPVRETPFEAGQEHGLERLFDPRTQAVVKERTYDRGNLVK